MIPETANNFVKLRRGILDHFQEEKITWDEWGLLIFLIIKANPVNGTVITSYQGLVDETLGKFKKNKINKMMLNLKKSCYIDFREHRGSNKTIKVKINKYPLSNKSYTNTNKKELNPAELENAKQNFDEIRNRLAKEKSINPDDG